MSAQKKGHTEHETASPEQAAPQEHTKSKPDKTPNQENKNVSHDENTADHTAAKDSSAKKSASKPEETAGKQTVGSKHKAKGELESAEPAKRPMTSKPLPEGALEEGRIFFFYRPRVAMDHPHSVDDVQRFYMIMSPVSGPDAPHRLLIVGKKRLPEKRERFFGFVEAVSDQMEKLTEEFGLKERETKTRGKRVTQPARVAGEGAYTLAEHGGNVVLAYKLEAPEQPGEVQDELGIKQESSLVISVKNPTIGSPPNAGLEHKAKYSEKQMQEFGDYNWIPVRDPSLLDVPHAEFLLILARAGAKDVKGEIGQAAEHMEQAAKEDVEHFKEEHPDDDAHTALIEKLRSETRAEKPHMPVEPAVEGKWE